MALSNLLSKLWSKLTSSNHIASLMLTGHRRFAMSILKQFVGHMLTRLKLQFMKIY